jgi:competence protein ComEA
MDLSTVSRGRAIAGALLLIVALFVAGRYLAGAGAAEERPAGDEPASGELRAEPAPRLIVHVVGAVRKPGLYRLTHGSRIADALRRAGGATRRADLSLVNLAAPLSDGTQVVVPRRAPAAVAGEAGTPAAGTPSGPVHLNTATVEQLDELPGVGPVTAQKIVDWRDQHGAFSSVDDLDAIPGIGPARLEQLRELVAP